jgi:hypothetical protein
MTVPAVLTPLTPLVQGLAITCHSTWPGEVVALGPAAGAPSFLLARLGGAHSCPGYFEPGARRRGASFQRQAAEVAFLPLCRGVSGPVCGDVTVCGAPRARPRYTPTRVYRWAPAGRYLVPRPCRHACAGRPAVRRGGPNGRATVTAHSCSRVISSAEPAGVPMLSGGFRQPEGRPPRVGLTLFSAYGPEIVTTEHTFDSLRLGLTT